MRSAKQRTISVRATTYAKLQEYARKIHEQVGTVLDALLNKYLDDQARHS